MNKQGYCFACGKLHNLSAFGYCERCTSELGGTEYVPDRKPYDPRTIVIGSPQKAEPSRHHASGKATLRGRCVLDSGAIDRAVRASHRSDPGRSFYT